MKNQEEAKDKVSNLMYKQVSLWLSVLSIVGIFLGGFLYLTGPSQDNNTAIQLQQQRITAQEETIDTITKTQQNDTQEVKANISILTEKVNAQNIAIEKLTTIIDERIPKK